MRKINRLKPLPTQEVQLPNALDLNLEMCSNGNGALGQNEIASVNLVNRFKKRMCGGRRNRLGIKHFHLIEKSKRAYRCQQHQPFDKDRIAPEIKCILSGNERGALCGAALPWGVGGAALLGLGFRGITGEHRPELSAQRHPRAHVWPRPAVAGPQLRALRPCPRAPWAGAAEPASPQRISRKLFMT